jgi:hypothetical protein
MTCGCSSTSSCDIARSVSRVDRGPTAHKAIRNVAPPRTRGSWVGAGRTSPPRDLRFCGLVSGPRETSPPLPGTSRCRGSKRRPPAPGGNPGLGSANVASPAYHLIREIEQR